MDQMVAALVWEVEFLRPGGGIIVGHFVVTGDRRYLNYRTYRVTYIVTRGSRRRILDRRRFRPQVAIVGRRRRHDTIAYRRYRSTPYTHDYPGNTVDRISSDVRIGRRGYVNYGSYIITYPFNAVRVILAPITTKGMGTATRGYSLYTKHRGNPTYIRGYPTSTLRLIASITLSNVTGSHHLHATHRRRRP